MCMIKEVWKDIPEYEGLYQISNYGRVKSLNYRTLGKEEILKQSVDSLGYCRVGLHNNREVKTFMVHRLVAKCFLEPIEGKDIVNHKDQNPSNNRVENLEFCTQQYNVTYNDAHIQRGINNRGKYKGENNPMYGKHHTEETKQKISEIQSERFKDKEKHPFYGKHHTEETKQKLSNSKKELFKYKENNPMYGKHHTEETKQKISKARKGKYKGENNPMYGKPKSEETKEKISKAISKPILQFTLDDVFIREWQSATQAEKELGYCSGCIGKCCNGKVKTSNGYIWRYK